MVDQLEVDMIKHNFSPCTLPTCPGNQITELEQLLSRAIHSTPSSAGRVVMIEGRSRHQPLGIPPTGWWVTGLDDGTIPYAIGLALAQPQLHPCLILDQSWLSADWGQLIEVAKINPTITILIRNDQPEQVQPLAIGLAAGFGFLARGLVTDPTYTQRVITNALKYPGLSLVELLQPCVLIDPSKNAAWYQQHTFALDEVESQPVWQPHLAWGKLQTTETRQPLGVLFYKR